MKNIDDNDYSIMQNCIESQHKINNEEVTHCGKKILDHIEKLPYKSRTIKYSTS